MENEIIYRFVSFDSFVDIVQRKALLFSHPSRWDDPREYYDLEIFLNLPDKQPFQPIFRMAYNLTFVNCWTRLAESDALWRIYNKGNNCVRISTFSNNFRKLNHNVRDVVYSDSFDMSNDADDSFSYKRISFKHEKEVRVIHIAISTLSKERARGVVQAFFSAYAFPSINVDNYVNRNSSISEQVHLDPNSKEYSSSLSEIEELTNYSLKRNQEYVSFEAIPQFINRVLVNPFADQWFVDMVETYCKINEIPFLGKSKLYDKNIDLGGEVND